MWLDVANLSLQKQLIKNIWIYKWPIITLYIKRKSWDLVVTNFSFTIEVWNCVFSLDVCVHSVVYRSETSVFNFSTIFGLQNSFVDSRVQLILMFNNTFSTDMVFWGRTKAIVRLWAECDYTFSFPLYLEKPWCSARVWLNIKTFLSKVTRVFVNFGTW